MHKFDPYTVTLDNNYLYKDIINNSPCHWDDKYQCWIISKYSDVTSYLKDYKKYTSNYGITFETLNKNKNELDNLPFFELDPPHHTIQRRIINRILSSQINIDLKKDIKNIFNTCIKNINIDTPIDVVNTIFLDYPISVISHIFGISEEDNKFLKNESKKLFNLSPANDQLDAINNIGKYFKNNTPNKIKKIINEEIKNIELVNNNLIVIAASIVIAGHETITAELSNLIYNCIKYKNEFNKILNNQNLIPSFVEESLRHRYMSHFVIRTAKEEHCLYNNIIKKGDTVLFLNGAANIDPDIYGDKSDEFLIERNYNKSNLAFGYGPHSCPGENLAKLEMIVALEYIINNYPKFYITSENRLTKFNLSGAVWENLYVQFSI